VRSETIRRRPQTHIRSRPWNRKPISPRSSASAWALNARSYNRSKVPKGLPVTSGSRVHLLASEPSLQTARAQPARARGERHDSDSRSRKGTQIGRPDISPDFRPATHRLTSMSSRRNRPTICQPSGLASTTSSDRRAAPCNVLKIALNGEGMPAACLKKQTPRRPGVSRCAAPRQPNDGALSPADRPRGRRRSSSRIERRANLN
jgi:hypothetical protein